MKKTQQATRQLYPRIHAAFSENMNGLASFLRRYLTRRQDIEDVLQDTYIKAIEAEKRTTIHNPRAFLYRVSRNLAINEKTRAFSRLSDALEDCDPSFVMDEGPGLDEALDQQARFKVFCRVVKTLPPQCRKVFVLRKVYGLSNPEIADYLNISVSTVEKHLIKGLAHCKGYMDRHKDNYLDSSARMTATGRE